MFYIKSLDRVIVTGVIEGGSVRTGDRLAVKTANGTVAVVVQNLESLSNHIYIRGKSKGGGLCVI